MSDFPIRPLTDALINQIAAGEVVERPVSIVKELVENSLDAGATQIRIEVEGGGSRRLLVRDNGRGIPRDELPLALRRHCTSKLREADQLAHLGTLGFRGEALAAIAAVGEVTLGSLREGADTAWQLRAALGAVPTPIAHPQGTSVEVRDLFARVPARRRFLRQPQTEWLHILTLVRRMAFCNPLVEFRLLNDGQRALVAPASLDQPSLERRLRALFGAEFVAAARWVERAAGRLRVCGYVAEAAAARSQADLQVLAVNGRVIRDRQLAHAVRLGFEDRLPAGRFPCFALQVDLPPEEVDVNVHPGKWEVRFRDLRAVHDLIYSSIKQSLEEESSSRFHTLREVSDSRWLKGGGLREAGLQHALYAADAPGSAGYSPAATLRERLTGKQPGAAQVRWLTLIAGRFGILKQGDSTLTVDCQGLAAAVLAARLAGPDPWVLKPLLFPVRVECAGEAQASLVESSLAALGLTVEYLAPSVLALMTVPVLAPEFDPVALGEALAGMDAAEAPRGFAVALASALRLPADAAEEGAAWWGRWQGLAAEAGVPVEAYVRVIDASALEELFQRGADGRR